MCVVCSLGTDRVSTPLSHAKARAQVQLLHSFSQMSNRGLDIPAPQSALALPFRPVRLNTRDERRSVSLECNEYANSLRHRSAVQAFLLSWSCSAFSFLFFFRLSISIEWRDSGCGLSRENVKCVSKKVQSWDRAAFSMDRRLYHLEKTY